MRLLTVFLTFLLVLTACAGPKPALPAASAPAPTAVPAEATAAATGMPVLNSQAPAANSSFETSLLASEWKGNAEGILLFPFDPASGAALPGYPPISLGKSFFHTFSPNKRTLAAVTYPNDRAYDGSLLLIDLLAWKPKQFELNLDGWGRSMVFSPDGERLAIAHGDSSYKLTMIDVQKGVIIAQEQTEPVITHMKFTADGEALMLYGSMIDRTDQMSAGAPQVLLLDTADLSVRWSVELEDVHDGIFPKDETVTPANIHEPGQASYISPGVTFAPDRDVLYVVHADTEQLTAVDFGAQEVKTVEIQPTRSWFERLLALTAGVAHAKIGDGIVRQAAVSPDGQFLYAVGVNSATFKDKQGNWQMEQTPLGLEIIQTSDGSRLERFESEATELSLSPDGRFLYLRHWGKDAPWTEIFDTANRQFITHKKWIFAVPALRLNGEYLLVSTFSTGEFTHHMSVLEPRTLSVLTKWTDSEYVSWLSP